MRMFGKAKCAEKSDSGTLPAYSYGPRSTGCRSGEPTSPSVVRVPQGYRPGANTIQHPARSITLTLDRSCVNRESVQTRFHVPMLLGRNQSPQAPPSG